MVTAVGVSERSWAVSLQRRRSVTPPAPTASRFKAAGSATGRSTARTGATRKTSSAVSSVSRLRQPAENSNQRLNQEWLAATFQPRSNFASHAAEAATGQLHVTTSCENNQLKIYIQLRQQEKSDNQLSGTKH